jgi:hypothetical protein
MVSTVSRLSQDQPSITSLDVTGGIGRLVNLRHLAYLCSMTFIDSLNTMQAPCRR